MKTRNTINPATVGDCDRGIIEILESRHKAAKVGEVADLLRVTPQHVYKMAAKGVIPSFRIGAAVRIASLGWEVSLLWPACPLRLPQEVLS